MDASKHISFQTPEHVFVNHFGQDEIWIASIGNGINIGNITNTMIVDFNNESKKVLIHPNPANEILIFENITTEVTEMFLI